jgi:hypothetical protein
MGSYKPDAEGNFTYFDRNGHSIIGLGNLSAHKHNRSSKVTVQGLGFVAHPYKYI